MGWGWGWGGDAITFLEVAHMLDATPRQRWCVNFLFFECKHGTLLVCSCVHMVLVCHVQVGVGLGWGCNHVSGSCTHAGCYATATLVCELSVFYVNMVRCWCVHVYTWCWCVMCRLGWGWGGDAITFLEVADMLDATPRQRWCVNFRFFYVNMVRQTACMANRVKWIRCKLQVIVDFSARFGEKN